VLRRVVDTDGPVHVGYIDENGNEVAPSRMAMVPTDIYPG
jgi:hypothetical protein